MIPSADLLHWLRDLPSRRALHTLELIAALLRKHRERTWDDRLSRAVGGFDRVDDSGDGEQIAARMQEILAFFKEPDSLRDVQFSQQAGHHIKPENEAAVNAQLGALTMQLLLSARQTIARLNWRRRRQ
jgi:hypothetical protein